MFSWSHGSDKRRSSTSSKYTRQQHITSYLTDAVLKSSTQKVNDTTYDTVFLTVNHQALLLRVHIPASATIAAPKMTLVGIRGNHPWLDSRMRVIGYSKIESDSTFIQSGILLNKAVNEVVRHFQLNPPSNLVIVDAGLANLQKSLGLSNDNATLGSNANNGHSNNTNGHSQQQGKGEIYVPSAFTKGNNYDHHSFRTPTTINEEPQPEPYKLPTHFSKVVTLSYNEQKHQGDTIRNLDLPNIPTVFEQLDSLDTTTMTEMLDNPEKLVQNETLQLSLIPYVVEIESLKNALLEANQTAAQENQMSKRTLEILVNEVKQLQQSLKTKVEKVNELQRQQMDLCKPMKKDKILSKLKKAKKQSFEESEELAYDWLSNGANDVDDFLEKFLKVRTVHHVRTAKMERLEHS